MGIGFIVLSTQYKKLKDTEESFHVVFSKVEKTSSVKGSNVNPKGKVNILDNGLSLDMEFQLSASHDELTYVATIHNDGTLPAEMIGVVESPNYQEERFQRLISPIMITTTDIQGKIIPAGEDISFKITVYYSPSEGNFTSKTVPYKVSLLAKSYE
jgi:hypothetical protein